MKNLTAIIIITIISGLIFSCEKQPFDFRSKFIGDYEITKISHYSIGATSPDSTLDSTYIEVYNGTIGYHGYEDIVIQYTHDNKFFGKLTTAPNRFLLSPIPENFTSLYIEAIFSEDSRAFDIKYIIRIPPPSSHTGSWFGWKNVTIKGRKSN